MENPNKIRWAVDRRMTGLCRCVRDRASKEVIGGLIRLRARGGMGKASGYLATRPSGQEREFKIQFDACYWLMQAFDAAQLEKSLKAVNGMTYKTVEHPTIQKAFILAHKAMRDQDTPERERRYFRVIAHLIWTAAGEIGAMPEQLPADRKVLSVSFSSEVER